MKTPLLRLVTPPYTPSTSTSAMSSLTQWSYRAVRPLMSKSGKLQHKALKHLRQRRVPPTQSPREAYNLCRCSKSVKAMLLLGRHQHFLKENQNRIRMLPCASFWIEKYNLKPLNLARSDTSKMRAIHWFLT
ncbi:hypothetical protein BT96DRAFT_459823 [Gymnopus androsaceus JB14]|uniref:Uncharacterized protein n=1 Tax=Gymnopus androsaceus JB14 TaxID=1447944 RepID=A0A6A4ICJ7_9AGAR|nr:hypothetical protein BT96DRAFT_459823 [Gymnopus androsaceus JB14]